MKLRRCPCCPNVIAADTLMCPICGCNPRVVRVRRYVALLAALGVATWLVITQVAY
jgi:hypothetical protein